MSQMSGGRPRSSSSFGGANHRRSFSNHRGGQNRSGQGNFRQPQRSRGAYIAPARYVQAAQLPEQQVAYQSSHTLADFGLEPALLANVLRHGYLTPTPIQDQAIPALMSGQDVIGIADTGTGKTAAFLLPLLNKVLLDPKQGVLILAPTRELALQIVDEFRIFADRLPVSSCLCIGGSNINPQIAHLRKNPHFVIGTPGRIKDLIQRRVLNTAMFTNVVLDEVDRMLDIGFRRDIQMLIAQLPAERQSAFFSATLNSETNAIAHSFLTNPVRIQIRQSTSNLHIEQDVIKLQPGQNKVDVLHNLLLQDDFTKVMVFGRTKHGINKLELILSQRGMRVTSIHGNKNQSARQRSLQMFKMGHVQALLATDVAARGIDIPDVTHVINFDEPQCYDDYIHRIGRTGRAGKLGKALTFVG